MHPSQATLLTSRQTSSGKDTTVMDSPAERQRKMAIAAANERNPSSSLRLRSNLLHKLGIRDEKTQLQVHQPPSRGLLDGVPVTKEPLKYDSDEEEDYDERQEPQPRSWTERLFFRPSSLENRADAASDASSSSSSSGTSSEKRLTFNETVSVVPIPMRYDYSDRVRERLWNDVDAILLNAQRNAVEFAAEGWDWRTVTEDEYMYRDAVSGELIHPVHMEEH